MNWTELSIIINHEAVELATNILENHGSNGVVIEDSDDLINQPEDKYGEIYALKKEDYPDKGVRLKAYFNEMTYDDKLRQQIKDELLNLDELDQHNVQFSEQIIAETDWENEWKNYFHPFRASKKFTIVPSWETYAKEADEELCIELDPGMAFGTGDHPTTSMCLKAIETYVLPQHSVIDVGTGSGILSIASHLIGVKRIKALDIDEMAVSVAKENFRRNHCETLIEAVPGNLLKDETEKFDIVIANILAHIIDEMIEDAYNTLNEGGYFITSGIIKEKYEGIQSHMERVGFKIISEQHDNGWVCLVGQKVNNVQRYFIDQNADVSQRFFITKKEDIHHITNVMRYDVGSKIILTFNDQTVYLCEIADITSDKIAVDLKEKQNINTELPVDVTICSGLIKADKYEWLLQKATELGASSFIAVSMERSIVKLNEAKVAKKIERWQKIIKEAAEQSYRLVIPSIQFESNLKLICDTIDNYDYILIAYEEEAKDGELSNFKQTLQQFKAQDKVLMIFGPEGGLSENEISLFSNTSTVVGLGPRILRAETAPLYALSAISYENELMG